jgi:peptidoglycan hydrolase CwlO-like protein
LNRTIYTLSFAAILTLATVLPGVAEETVSASKLSDLNSQKNKLSQEKSQVDSELNSADNKLKEIQNEQEAVQQEKKRIDYAIGETNNKMIRKSQEIEGKKGEIEQLKTEIQQITDRINKRNDMLKERVRSFQENGRVGYLDVLVGAQSFGDFIDRMGAVATFVEADQDILRKHQEDKKLLEEKQNQLENDLASLENMLNELEVLKTQLSGELAKQNEVMAELEQQEDKAHAEVLAKEEEAQILAAQQAAIQQAIKMEQQRIAAEEEARRQQAAANGGNSGTGGTGGAQPPVSSGSWTKPAVGIFTSGLGQRWGTFHAGIDIANSVSVPIVAAADGVVIRSYSSPSYGECIFVSHFMNGQVYTTVYAHMSSRSVGSGAVVSKGQTIGYMGNTGDSTGQHLHFELHVGEWNASKSNAVNPLKYIPM